MFLLARHKSHAEFIKVTTFLLLAVGVISLLWIGPIMVNPDSTQFLQGSPIRSPIYSLLLKGYQYFFHNNFYPLIGFQILLGMGSVWYFSSQVQRLYHLNDGLWFLILLIMLSPYVYGDYKFGNRILSEAICYPMYLIAIVQLIKGLSQHTWRPLLNFSVLTFLLILIRKQFIFIYPVFIAAVIYVWAYFYTSPIKYKFTAAFIGVFLLTGLLEKTYAYVQFNHFSSQPTSGFDLVIPLLYLSTPEDAEKIKDPNLRVIFSEIMALNHHHQDTLQDSKQIRVAHYYFHYMSIYNEIMWHNLLSVLEKKGVTNWYDINPIALKLALNLLAIHPIAYAKLFLYGLQYKLGGYYMAGLLFFAWGVSFIYHLKNRDPLTLAVCLTLALAFSNNGLIAMVEPFIRRYTSYTETMQTVFLIILIFLAMKNSNKIVPS
ncbi:MAG TPA: hypothetical protein VJB02_03240 [Coxiellaceae bacterium]|nr:hypothetical protein [Coxiellaceae bacterium]